MKMSLVFGPDLSSSEDDFEDLEFKERMKQLKLEQIQKNLIKTEEQLKEEKLKKIKMDIISKRNDEVIKEINNGLDLNERLEDDWTLISLAASVANYDLVVQLYERGADANLRKGSDTVLMCACNCPLSRAPFEESSEVVKFLIEKGVDVNAKNNRRMNALMVAASNGNLNAVESLLPYVDVNETDYQNWNVLFWAVYSGNIDLVIFLINRGMATNQTDIRDKSLLDIATDHNYKDLIQYFMPLENDMENLDVNSPNNFEDIFDNLKEGERPQFFQDVRNLLYGTRSECLIKLFVTNKIDLLNFLSSSEEELKSLEIKMPFLIRRILAGIHRFHKTPFHPKSLPTVGKDELYSNVDIAAFVLSAVKQFICMEAAFNYIMKNTDNLDSLHEKEEIAKNILPIEFKLRRLKKVLNKLQIRAAEWDKQTEPVNIITSKSIKNKFPWRKTIAVMGIFFAVSVKFWGRPVSLIF